MPPLAGVVERFGDVVFRGRFVILLIKVPSACHFCRWIKYEQHIIPDNLPIRIKRLLIVRPIRHVGTPTSR